LSDGQFLVFHPLVRLGQKSTGATGRVVDRLADLWIYDIHNESDHRPRGIELPSHAVFVPQAFEEIFVYLRHGEYIVFVMEVDLVENQKDIFEVIP